MNNNLRLVILIAVLCGGSVMAQVSRTVPAPNRNITGSSPQHSPGEHPESVAGSIEGFVYWDVQKVSHVPANSCNGLAITVSVGSSSGGPLTAYTPLGTLSNNFKYIGQVREFLAGGKINVYDVCAYAYDKVPVGPSLQVRLTVTQATAFSSGTTPQFEILGPITIINGKCNMLPRIMDPTFSDLGAHWGSCQDMAYNVNFAMLRPGALGARAPAPGNVRGATNSASPGSALLKDAGTAGTPMLSSSPQGGMLTSGVGAATQSPSTAGAVQQNPAQASPAVTDRSHPTSAGTERIASRQTLTNADVTRMMEAGVAESVIISLIRSARKNFDFSPAGCQALQRARVSVGVLAAMGDDAARRPCTSVPPGNTVGQGNEIQQCQTMCVARCNRSPNGNRTDCAKTCNDRCSVTRPPVAQFSLPKSTRKLTNPRLAEYDSEIVAVLQQQRQTAERDSAEISSVARSVAESITARTANSVALKTSSPVQPLGPETVQDVHRNLGSAITTLPHLNTIVLICSKDPTPRVIQVSGGQSHTVFTPEAKYNPYTIMGCGFGPSRTGNSAYITSGSGFKATLNIDSWSDNGITAHLDPWLAGVLDQDVTLVVAPALVRAIQQPGFKFYATRGMPNAQDGTAEEVPLAYNSLPQSAVGLSSVTDVQAGWDSLPSNATSAFPSFSFQGNPVAGWVFRYAYGHDDDGEVFNDFDPTKTVGNYECWINGQKGYEFTDVIGNQIIAQEDDCLPYFARANTWTNNLWGPFGADQWNIPLRSEFAISSYQLYYQDTDPSQICGAWDDSSKDSGHLGNWDFNLTGPNQISVSYQLYWCFDQEAWPFNRVNGQRQSAYGLAVWVWGPRCVDPITSQPDQSCINTVRQRLGG